MLVGRIYSRDVIDNPTHYLDTTFGKYWVTIQRTETVGARFVQFTATEECRRLCEVSRNIDIIPQVEVNRTWEDGSPVPTSDSGEQAINRW